MKTKTLVIAAVITGVLMLVSLFPRDGSDRNLIATAFGESVAEDAQASKSAGAETESFEAVDVTELTENEPLVSDEGTVPDDDLIEIDTERELAPGIEVMMGDEGRDLISITLDDVPIQDVVRMFTRISGANIVAGTNLVGNVTVSLQDVEWKPAFQVILDSVDMVLVQKTPGIYSIMSKDALATEPVTVDTVFLNFTTVSNVLPVVERMLISTNAAVSPFPSANALVIQETVGRLNTIKDVISQIDLPRPQVYIEAKFVELNDSNIRDIGIDWSILGSDESGLGYTIGGNSLERSFTETQRELRQDALAEADVLEFVDETDRPAGVFDTQSVEDEFLPFEGDPSRTDDIAGSLLQVGGKNFTDVDFAQGTIETVPVFEQTDVLTSVLTAEDFQVTLSALDQLDGVDIISNPKVIIANEEEATIHVGRNEPNVVAVPQGDTGDRFAFTLDSRQPFIEIGVKLNVTPTVNTEESITVKLVPELSRLIGQKVVGEGATQITFPITQIRRVVTEFNLESGSTVAIGGLTETDDVESINKVPLLGDIPFIGKYLFTHTHTEKVQDEVIIFVTVGLAEAKNLVEVAGVPSEGKLIHEFLARQAQERDAP